MITVTNLSRIYHQPGKTIPSQALDTISFSLATPGIYGVLGYNGAGKTTLLKILMGLITPSTGTVSVLGYIPHKRDHSYLAQIGFVSGQRSVLDLHIPINTSYYLLGAMYGLSSIQTKERIQELSSLLHLHDKLHIPLRNLSLGERMKAEIVGAILHKPQVLFLDEPTIGLDFQSQKAIRSIIQEEQDRYQSYVFLTSHYARDIHHLCDQYLILDQGNLCFSGDYQQLLQSQVDNEFVRSLYNELTV